MNHLKRFIGAVMSVSILTVTATLHTFAATGTPRIIPQTTLTTLEKAQIDAAFWGRLDNQDTDMLDEKLESLKTKLVVALIAYQRNSFLLAVLWHIESLVNQAEEDREQGMFDDDTEDEDMDDNNDDNDDNEDGDWDGMTPFMPQLSSFTSGPRIILGGERSEIVANREIVASREDIRIGEVEITASDDVESSIERIYLFDENETFIGSARFEWDTATFQGLDYVLEQGAVDFFVLVDASQIGRWFTGPEKTDFTLQLRITEAVGVSSNKNITPSTYNNTTDRIRIAPVMITNIQLTNSFENRRSDTRLYDNTDNDLALLVIETADSPNYRSDSATEANTRLHSLRFRVNDQTDAGNIANSLKLERVDVNSDPIEGDLDDGMVIFDLGDFDTDADIIENGETAVFIIHGIVNLDDDNNDDEFVEIELVDSDAGGIVYSSNSPNAPTFNAVYLNTTIESSITIEE